jgi:hypothetical protein
MLGAEGVRYRLRDFPQIASLNLPLLESDDLVHQAMDHHVLSSCA